MFLQNVNMNITLMEKKEKIIFRARKHLTETNT